MIKAYKHQCIKTQQTVKSFTDALELYYTHGPLATSLYPV